MRWHEEGFCRTVGCLANNHSGGTTTASAGQHNPLALPGADPAEDNGAPTQPDRPGAGGHDRAGHEAWECTLDGGWWQLSDRATLLCAGAAVGQSGLAVLSGAPLSAPCWLSGG